MKVAAHRLRQQFSAALRAEIGSTIDLQEEPLGQQAIEDELQVLMQALSGD